MYNKLCIKKPSYLFIPFEYKLEEEYRKGFGVTELMETNGVGIVTGKDAIFTGKNEETLIKQINNIVKKIDINCIHNIRYRPFDDKVVYYDNNYIARPRTQIMSHMLNEDNIGLCFCRSNQGTRSYDNVFISDKLTDLTASSMIPYLAPLYLYE
jgi:predicted helicase